MPSPATCRLASAIEQIAAQQAVIAKLEAMLWDNGFNEAPLAAYQSAWRRLEALITTHDDDRRHHFVLVIPVADSPQQIKTCLDSLLELCRAFGYGGMRNGYFQKVSIIIADDTQDADLIAAHRVIARAFDQQGIATTYFGLTEQIALLDTIELAASLAPIVGNTPREAFGHKGQAMMRNLGYLKLAQMPASNVPLLIYTLDADQQFKVKVETANGDRNVCAVNFLAELDAIFSETSALVLTGKVVGDPPVSPAVMAGNFLDDVTGFLCEMAAGNPSQPYDQHVVKSLEADAAYHDMAELFGFKHTGEPYRYRCALEGSPSNADCFGDFAARLNRFFHGEHPTRVSHFRYQPPMGSVQPARTVYTGNYVFRPEALGWFIPFAPLRLRMSGPTLGRLMKAELGARFVSANLPMLHTRTLDATGQSEFRPGVIASHDAIDLSDEFERQFYGDVMLFTVERLTSLGYPQQVLSGEAIAEVLDQVHHEMEQKYRASHETTVKKLDALSTLLNDPAHWWHASAHANALARFRVFIDNMQHNFGVDSPGLARIASDENWQAWRSRQLAALSRFHRDRHAWNQTLTALKSPPE
jgi:hypothetical protein